MTESSEPAARRIVPWWVGWIALYNAVFIGMLIAVSTAEFSLFGFLPTTVWLYGGLLIVIAGGNWTFGWIIMSRRR